MRNPRRQEVGTPRFRCVLDEQPTLLVPRFLRPRAPVPRDAVFHPTLLLSWSGRGLPVIDRLPKTSLGSDEAGSSLLVRDTRFGVLHRYSVGDRMRGLLVDASPGQRPPSSASPRELEVLATAGVIVAARNLTESTRSRAENLALAARSFATNGYARIVTAVHPFQLGEVRRYYREVLRRGLAKRGDRQSPGRSWIHNEPLAGALHSLLAEMVSLVAKERVKPSYSYLVSYESGARLPEHVDRPQCAYTLSLLIDFAPEPVIESPWPLKLRTHGGIVSVHQAIGDALLYRGCTLPHFRDEFRCGNTSTLLFLHYVPEGFEGMLA